MRKILQRAYFRRQFRDAMRDGVKTATTRASKLGQVGDLFFVHGALFEITSIERAPLRLIAKREWTNEGCMSEADFIETWQSIHGHFEPESDWWFHRFRRLRPGTRLVVTNDGVEAAS